MEIWDEDFDGSFSGVTPRKGGAPSSGVHVGVREGRRCAVTLKYKADGVARA
jgi:hypothetical protein